MEQIVNENSYVEELQEQSPHHYDQVTCFSLYADIIHPYLAPRYLLY